MTVPSVWAQRQKLDNLFEEIASFHGDPELEAHWAKYLCVLVSGFIETSVRSIYAAYARDKAAPYVTNFVESQLKNYSNLKMERILELSRYFSPEWERELRESTKDEPKDAVDSIVANKNSIAHGESIGLTYGRVKRYYGNVVGVIELIEHQCRL
jgi:hypothetical protein